MHFFVKEYSISVQFDLLLHCESDKEYFVASKFTKMMVTLQLNSRHVIPADMPQLLQFAGAVFNAHHCHYIHLTHSLFKKWIHYLLRRSRGIASVFHHLQN